MASGELSQSDKDMMLMAEAFCLGQWDLYQEGWTADVRRRIRERWPDTTATDAGSVAGTDGQTG